MPVRGVRRRYLAFRVESDGALPIGLDVESEVIRSVRRLYGLEGQSEINPVMTAYDEATRSGIARCTHTGERRLRAALAMVTAIGGHPAAIRVTCSSGTIKTLRQKTKPTKPGETAD